MLKLLRWTFPYVLLACLAAVYIGILNARGHFLVPALGAVMLNVVMIASVLWLSGWSIFGTELRDRIFALAIGVLAAGFVQAFFQMPLMHREGYRYRWESPWRNDMVRLVVQRMLPASIGVAAFQLNVVLTDGIAFFVDPSIIASFDYAVRMMELPQGVFGISMATYLLPTLSGLAIEKNYGEFRATVEKGIEHLLFMNLLASVLLAVLAVPIIRLLFEHGRFDAIATYDSASALACLAPGLIAYSTVNILARAFFALGDTHTPMRISVACLITNLLLASFFLLVLRMRQVGLGVANSATAFLQLGLLAYALKRKLPNTRFAEVLAALPRLLGCTVLAGAVAFVLLRTWDRQLGNGSLWLCLGEVFVPMTAASVIYWGMTWWAHVPSAREIAALLLSRLRGQ
jgi:putative peptidoglycan lipid II flippase